ncbi:hypothetical protein [Micromonospora sp. KC606]|uniref:hypothetical protein n=1 Tax=Micromonospora sp. KC606 TaxID=2530379 RepID=UPI001FB7078A|nr:hypothetical protein [Micromonospora sp. KC606]
MNTASRAVLPGPTPSSAPAVPDVTGATSEIEDDQWARIGSTSPGEGFGAHALACGRARVGGSRL